MSIVNAKEIMVEAVKGKYAVGAFNITDLLQFEAVVDAAIEKKAPVIVQTSVKPSKFFGPNVMVAIYRTLAKSAPIPVCLHLDHCTEIDYCKKCADAGYTNIMIDASKQSYEENIRQTKEVADYCHKVGEHLGRRRIGNRQRRGRPGQGRGGRGRAGKPEPGSRVRRAHRHRHLRARHRHRPWRLQDQEPESRFRAPGKDPQDVEWQDIKTPLVVHGGTGLPEDYIKKLLASGGAKFNVSTELKHTLIDTTYNYITAHRDEYDPGKIDAAVRDAIRKAVGHWIDMLESAGKA